MNSITSNYVRNYNVLAQQKQFRLRTSLIIFALEYILFMFSYGVTDIFDEAKKSVLEFEVTKESMVVFFFLKDIVVELKQ